MEIFMRKHYLDNIRFLTIFFVVIFHVYFYYNNIGTEAMFAGLKPYEGAVTFAGIYQYFYDIYCLEYSRSCCIARTVDGTTVLSRGEMLVQFLFMLFHGKARYIGVR